MEEALSAGQLRRQRAEEARIKESAEAAAASKVLEARLADAQASFADLKDASKKDVRRPRGGVPDGTRCLFFCVPGGAGALPNASAKFRLISSSDRPRGTAAEGNSARLG
mmetsp:Transcript_26368/g.81160  ORF Transcript_26368/g.81160 Transcript_26368/m.81160 type:complete len:110 (-) Transcript_26368:294-623(-)